MGVLDRHIGKPICPAKAGDPWRVLCMQLAPKNLNEVWHLIKRWLKFYLWLWLSLMIIAVILILTAIITDQWEEHKCKTWLKESKEFVGYYVSDEQEEQCKQFDIDLRSETEFFE